MEPRGADAASPTSRTYLVERFVPASSQTEVEAFVSSARAKVALAEQGVRVAALWSVYVPAEELCLCVIEAPSREAVEQAAAQSSLIFDRIVEVVAIGVDKRRREA